MKKIKLIWDFRGSDVEEMAKHHAVHLKQFLAIKKYDLDITGFEVLNESHSIAFMVVLEADMISFRDALKPHRAVYYEE